MQARNWQSARLIAAAVVLVSTAPAAVLAQSQDPSRSLANNDSLFIDGHTFHVTPGIAKGDAAGQIGKLRARELGAGALIFRSNDRLYIADAAPVPAGASVYNPAPESEGPYASMEPGIDCRHAPRDPSCLPVVALRDPQLDYERQRPLGLRDSQLDYERQRPLGLRDSQLDYERQRPLGLRDSQLDYERQRPLGLREADAGVYINDPEYAYYRLKKAFDESWTPAGK